MTNNTRVHKQRINLRPRRQSDAQALFPTMSHPDSMQWWSRGPFSTPAELYEYFAPDKSSGWDTWAIVKADDDGDRAIGFVAACTKRKGVAEIGYLVARQELGKGYGCEAVAMLIERLFKEGKRKLVADVDPENGASVALLAKLGFELEGRLRAEWETHIGVRDSLIYGLLADEWQSPFFSSC